MRRVIGLTGKKGSGKTTVANFFVDFHGFQRISFADPLKMMIIEAGLCTFKECYIEKTDYSRMLMQKIGTEIIRERVDRDFWETKIRERIMSMTGDIIMDDVRFLAEAKMLIGLQVQSAFPCHVNLYRVIKLSDIQIIDTHRSETEQDSIMVDEEFIAKEGEIEKLQELVRNWRGVY